MYLICFECMYCGHIWKDNMFYIPKKSKCSICSETKNIKIKKVDDKGNVFGYDEDEKIELIDDVD